MQEKGWLAKEKFRISELGHQELQPSCQQVVYCIFVLWWQRQV